MTEQNKWRRAYKRADKSVYIHDSTRITLVCILQSSLGEIIADERLRELGVPRRTEVIGGA